MFVIKILVNNNPLYPYRTERTEEKMGIALLSAEHYG